MHPISPWMLFSLRPTFEHGFHHARHGLRAPLRMDTSNIFAVPYFLPMMLHLADGCLNLCFRVTGICVCFGSNKVQTSVVTIKPGGTGSLRPGCPAISAKLAPLPNKFSWIHLPSAFPPPKNIHTSVVLDFTILLIRLIL